MEILLNISYDQLSAFSSNKRCSNIIKENYFWKRRKTEIDFAVKNKGNPENIPWKDYYLSLMEHIVVPKSDVKFLIDNVLSVIHEKNVTVIIDLSRQL